MEFERIPHSVLTGAASNVYRIVSDFYEQIGGAPTLSELLEILTLAGVDVALPSLEFKEKVKGGCRGKLKSRVCELNDSVFVEAVDFISLLYGEGWDADLPRFDVSACFKTSGAVPGDLDIQEVSLVVAAPVKVSRKATPGDLIAIPAEGGGYHMAVVVTRNRFGTAFGVRGGISRYPRFRNQGVTGIRGLFYSDEHLVASGVWRVVGHDANVLKYFPRDPEVFHEPGYFPGRDQFGSAESAESAESADGAIRMLTEGEAEEVRGRGYKQVYMSEELQRFLDESVGEGSSS